MEDNERRSRDEFSERTETFYWEIEDSIDRSENPEEERMNFALDELYAFVSNCDRFSNPGADLCQVFGKGSSRSSSNMSYENYTSML